MGSELLKIAEGFSIVAEGLCGLAKAEGGTKEKAVKAQPSATEKAQKQDAAQEQPATLEGIRALMAQKTQEGKSKEIILSTVGGWSRRISCRWGKSHAFRYGSWRSRSGMTSTRFQTRWGKT